MLRRLAAIALCVLLIHRYASAADWTNWRGPQQDGSSRETNLPLSWSETSGIVWKCKLPEYGNSTPIISGNSIFLTSHVEDRDLVLVEINKATGTIEWTRKVGAGSTERAATKETSGGHRGAQKFHKDQNLASSSVVTDGQIAVAHFGNGDLAAYDFTGRQLWYRNLQKDYGKYTIWWGHANSPVLCGDLVISVCMQDSCSDLGGPPSPSYLVAHDKRTGEERWKTMRMTDSHAEYADSYTTPLVRQNSGRTELVLMGSEMLDAYDPATGHRLWWLPGLAGNRIITSPVAAGDLIVATRGKAGQMAAVRPGGLGQRPLTDIVWHLDRGTPDTPVPTVWDGLLFLVSDNGIASCLDARTGEVQWQERLKGRFRASPLAADGRVCFLNMEGQATVVAAVRKFEKLAENKLDDVTLASPVVSDGRIYIRGHQRLYSIGK